MEAEHTNETGSNDATNPDAAHKLYKKHIGKKFDLEHWYEMLKDQPKWRAICDPLKLVSGSSKRSNPNTEEVQDEGVGGSERPEGRKAAKRWLKEKVNDTTVDLVTTQLKELNNSNSDISQIFKDFITNNKRRKSS